MGELVKKEEGINISRLRDLDCSKDSGAAKERDSQLGVCRKAELTQKMGHAHTLRRNVRKMITINYWRYTRKCSSQCRA